MNSHPTTRDVAIPRPLGDDWLNCDAETIGGAGADEPDEPACPTRLRRALEDVLLYVAGISTGCLVVGLVLALGHLLSSEQAVVRAASPHVTVVLASGTGSLEP